MKKRTATKATSSQPIGDDIDVELLIAAADAHPDWEVLPNGDGFRHLGAGSKHAQRATRMVF